jgi:predicted RND superfamily exporter protein
MRREARDIMNLPIYEMDIITGETLSESTPLYTLLTDDSFGRDTAGNVIYSVGIDGVKTPASLALSDGYASITHVDRQKCITITVEYDVEQKSAVLTAADSALADYRASRAETSSITVTTDGGSDLLDEIFGSLVTILVFAIALIFLVMVAQFQSWRMPIIVMATIPLAFTGSILLLMATGMSLSVMALMGLIILMGVVVNNGIVFVDYANRLITAGVSKREALLRTGVDRLRPILMTAVTTIIAMMIMALDDSDYGSVLQPLAIATVGGLVYATVLTLLIVPIIYDIITGNKSIVRRRAKLAATKAAESEYVDDEDVFENHDCEMANVIKNEAETPPFKIIKIRKTIKGSNAVSADKTLSDADVAGTDIRDTDASDAENTDNK